MLTGIVVFSLQPGDKTATTPTNKAVALTTKQTNTTIVVTSVKSANLPMLLTRSSEIMRKTA